MKPQIQSCLRTTQNQLKVRANKLFLSLLQSLLQENKEHIFLGDFASALRARDFPRLMRSADSLSEQQYPDATSHFVANQVSLLVRKYPWPKDLLDLKPRETAIKQFNFSEKRCSLINRKFSFLYWNYSRNPFAKEDRKARASIRRIIGECPSYRKISDESDFGPGASLGVHGNATNHLAKLLSETWSCTPGVINMAFKAIIANQHFLEVLLPRGANGLYCYDLDAAFRSFVDLKLHVVCNNKISFVPKTAKTERSIAIEPLLNGFVQKGIDQVMRKCLTKIGIDLSDQSMNQRFAREGSTNDSDEGFVTIDLKSASDSLSIETCRHLLPPEWFYLLDRARSHTYELDGVIKTYEKFCSMGNGFCFPLETLIFTAACLATDCGVPGTDFIVYGDDIIVRKRCAPSVLNLLKHWGFKVNTSKTFLSGKFRESCGSDWFGGQDVRPYTLDHAFDSVENIFKFLNLSRRNERTELFFRLSRRLLIEALPTVLRLFRPLPGQPDSGIDATGDEHLTAPSCHFDNKKGHWVWWEIVQKPILDFSSLDRCKDQPWLICVALRGAKPVTHGSLVYLPSVTLRRKTETKIVRKGYSATSNWLPAPGLWVKSRH